MYSKDQKIGAKAHGGPIEIYGVTVASVDDKVRLRSVDTWFDPLEMFRQIAPHGVVNREAMNRKTDPETALDLGSHDEPPHHDGVKIADEHNYHEGEHSKEPAPEDVLPKHISNGTGKAADAFVPHQGADSEKPTEGSKDASATSEAPQTVVEAAATQGADMELEKPESNFHDAVTQQEQPVPASANGSAEHKQTMQSFHEVGQKANLPEGSAAHDVPRSIYSSSMTGDVENAVKAAHATNYVDESTATGTHDALDEHLESGSEKVHPHPHDMEQAVHPQAGEAVAVPANSEETRRTHEEMSRISPGECPFLMNRE